MDGSKASINASNSAINMAKKLDASLIVLCIVSPTNYIDIGYANVGRMKEIESTEKKRVQQEIVKVEKRQWKRRLPLRVMFLLNIRRS